MRDKGIFDKQVINNKKVSFSDRKSICSSYLLIISISTISHKINFLRPPRDKGNKFYHQNGLL